jgi:hypothetical protein
MHPTSLADAGGYMRDPSQLKEELNRASAKLLLIDADVALTFAEVALTTRDETNRKRAVKDARRAYDEVCTKRHRFKFSDSDGRTLNAKLEQVRAQLERLETTNWDESRGMRWA